MNGETFGDYCHRIGVEELARAATPNQCKRPPESTFGAAGDLMAIVEPARSQLVAAARQAAGRAPTVPTAGFPSARPS